MKRLICRPLAACLIFSLASTSVCDAEVSAAKLAAIMAQDSGLSPEVHLPYATKLAVTLNFLPTEALEEVLGEDVVAEVSGSEDPLQEAFEAATTALHAAGEELQSASQALEDVLNDVDGLNSDGIPGNWILAKIAAENALAAAQEAYNDAISAVQDAQEALAAG